MSLVGVYLYLCRCGYLFRSLCRCGFLCLCLPVSVSRSVWVSVFVFVFALMSCWCWSCMIVSCVFVGVGIRTCSYWCRCQCWNFSWCWCGMIVFCVGVGIGSGVGVSITVTMQCKALKYNYVKRLVHSENTSDARHTIALHNLGHVLLGYAYYIILYYTLSHALKNTVSQRPGLPMHILRYSTSNMQRVVFHSTFASLLARNSSAGVLLRTSQSSAPKLFNSCKPLLTVPITSGNFCDNFRTLLKIPKIFRKFQKIIKSSEKHF